MLLKTKEELNALKNEVETLNKKLAELTDEELPHPSSRNSAASGTPALLSSERVSLAVLYTGLVSLRIA